jgi:hypothetical protein
MYVNYMQHFDCDIGRGVVWKSQTFNAWFKNFGHHDEHHLSPSTPASATAAGSDLAITRAKIGLFDPRVFAAFLRSPAALRRALA